MIPSPQSSTTSNFPTARMQITTRNYLIWSCRRQTKSWFRLRRRSSCSFTAKNRINLPCRKAMLKIISFSISKRSTIEMIIWTFIGKEYVSSDIKSAEVQQQGFSVQKQLFNRDVCLHPLFLLLDLFLVSLLVYLGYFFGDLYHYVLILCYSFVLSITNRNYFVQLLCWFQGQVIQLEGSFYLYCDSSD